MTYLTLTTPHYFVRVRKTGLIVPRFIQLSDQVRGMSGHVYVYLGRIQGGGGA